MSTGRTAKRKLTETEAMAAAKDKANRTIIERLNLVHTHGSALLNVNRTAGREEEIDIAVDLDDDDGGHSGGSVDMDFPIGSGGSGSGTADSSSSKGGESALGIAGEASSIHLTQQQQVQEGGVYTNYATTYMAVPPAENQQLSQMITPQHQNHYTTPTGRGTQTGHGGQATSIKAEEERNLASFTADQQSCGQVDTLQTQKNMCKETVRGKLFGNLKFVHDTNLLFGSRLSTEFARAVGWDPKCHAFEQYWNGSREVIRKAFNAKRSTVTQAVQKVFLSKL